MRQIILDTETTGLDPTKGHRLIEIGALELVNRRFTQRHFQVYLNPEREIDPEATKIHGITQAFLADKPLFSQVADEFLAFIRDAELIIHNAAFDLSFLDAELRRFNPEQPKLATRHSIIDTLLEARKLHPGARCSLDALCKRYHINYAHRQLHGALLDAQLLAQVYLAMTGGQGTLFTDELPAANQLATLTTAAIATPIIYANAEELAAHAQRLAAIGQTAAQAEWSQIQIKETP